MDEEYDVVKIGYGDDCQTFPISEDLKRCEDAMKKQVSFPKWHFMSCFCCHCFSLIPPLSGMVK